MALFSSIREQCSALATQAASNASAVFAGSNCATTVHHRELRKETPPASKGAHGSVQPSYVSNQSHNMSSAISCGSNRPVTDDKQVPMARLMQQRANGHIAQLTALLDQERAASANLQALLADRENKLQQFAQQRLEQARQEPTNASRPASAPEAPIPMPTEPMVVVSFVLSSHRKEPAQQRMSCDSSTTSSPRCGSPITSASPSSTAPSSPRASFTNSGADELFAMAATIAELQHKLAASESAAAAAAAEQSKLQSQLQATRKALKETKTDVQALQFDLADAQQQSAGLSVQLAQARAAADAACQLQAAQAAGLEAAGSRLAEAQQAVAGLRAAAEADAVRLAEQAAELAACRKALAACQAQRDRAEQLAQQVQRRAERAEGEAVTLSLDLQQERNGHMRARAQKTDMENLYLKAKARRHERKALLLWLLDCGEEEAGKAADHVPLVGRLQQQVERHAKSLRRRERSNAALRAQLDFAQGELQQLQAAAGNSSSMQEVPAVEAQQ